MLTNLFEGPTHPNEQKDWKESGHHPNHLKIKYL